jgi:hypothetical protein
MFFELYDNFDKDLMMGHATEGVIIYIYGPDNRVIDTIMI